MNPVASACPYDEKYGPVNVKLDRKAEGLFVVVETARLRILSVNSKDYQAQLTDLYGDKEVNRLVGAGTTLDADAVSQKIQRWIGRWSAHNPFSGYVVVEKSTGEFVGQIILKPVKDKTVEELKFLPGIGEIGYLSVQKHWGRGYGKEFTHAVVHHLVPKLIAENYQVQGHPIRELMATTRPDNVASNHVLQAFLTFTEQKERYGSSRMWYRHVYVVK